MRSLVGNDAVNIFPRATYTDATIMDAVFYGVLDEVPTVTRRSD
jgi:hypothetical protein